jgi:hypothetical protein
MMESRLFGLAKSEVCKLAFELAEKNNLSNSFTFVTKTAGSNWFKSFMRRHSQLSLRVPEPISAARASAFNKPIVTKFFETLSELLKKNEIPPERMYNCDETGIQTSHKPGKIVATTGRKQVGSLTSCLPRHGYSARCVKNRHTKHARVAAGLVGILVMSAHN